MTKEDKLVRLYTILAERDLPPYPIAARNAGVGYTDYLTGAHRAGPFNYAADGGGDYVYTPHRHRQCSIGYHAECSDPDGESCGCVCHQIERLL